MKSVLLREDLLSVLGASGVRVALILMSLVSVPLLLAVLGNADYGTWVTLTSILVWMTFFDFGVGNSLRNTVARLGVGDDVLVYREIFGLFRFVCIVAFLVFLAFLGGARFFSLMRENWLAACCLYPVYLFFFPLTLGGSILQGMGRVALQSVLQAIASVLFFLFLLVCYVFALKPALPILAGVFSLSFALSSVAAFVAAMWLLKIGPGKVGTFLASPIPRSRVGVGLGFLLLQLASLVLYNLGNLIIYNQLGAEDVARYDTINKVFQAGFSFYSILISVMWARISRLLAGRDFVALRRLHGLMFLIGTVFGIVMLLASLLMPTVIEVWTSGRIHVSRLEVFASALLIAVQAVAYAGAVFMNAFERINIQVIMAVVATLLMLPLSMTLISAGYGISGVAFSAALLTFLPMVVCNFYAYSMLRNTAHAEKNI